MGYLTCAAIFFLRGSRHADATDPGVSVLVLLFLIILVFWAIAAGGGQKARKRNGSGRKSLGTSRGASASAEWQKRQQPPDFISLNLGGPEHEKGAAIPQPREALRRLWVPPGEHVKVHGYEIPGGMIYLGSHLAQVSGHGVEPALVDPNLPLLGPSQLYRGEQLPYWPSYSNLSPNARGLYLRWLSGGRQDPEVNVGVVFLFFYGLERRLLAEASAVGDSEKGALIQEIERLLSIYGRGGSFRYYASELRQFAPGSLRERAMSNDPVGDLDDERNWGRNLQLIIGKMAAIGEPLPAKWALRWLMKSDYLYYPPPTPARRCREEFSRLYQIRYQEKFGAGLLLQSQDREIPIEYKPASASFSGTTFTRMAKLPDIRPCPELRELAIACSNELDGYSRFLGRNPDRRLAPEAINLIPTELLTELEDKSLVKLIAWLSETVRDKEIVTIEFTELESLWPNIHHHHDKRDAVSLARCLEKLGFGLEPDIRDYGSYQLFLDGKLVLFKLAAGTGGNPSPEFRAALLAVHLVAMVLKVDGNHGRESEDRILETLHDAFRLAASERQRLRARLRWLLVSKMTTACDRTQIEELAVFHRTIVAQILVQAVAPLESPARIKALEHCYGLLGMETEKLYSDLQRASTMPVTVQGSDPRVGGFAIPPPPNSVAHEKDRLEIDMTKVSAIQAETQQVSELLQDIFVGDDRTVAANVRLPPAQASVLGLSPAQSAFLRVVVSKASWTRAELEGIARDQQVLLDGAIDAINEKTLDNFGEPLLEGTERIDVNSAALKELAL